MTSKHWLIYGAYGFTGELVVREAVDQGLQPILAGRRAGPLEALSQELGLPYRAFGLDDEAALAHLLEDIDLVLHCAGPFIRTSRQMVDACLQAGAHYVDITGEIGVFESILRRDVQARDARVVLLPGAGLDVVPTDCLAVHLARQLPDATHLELALAADRGTASRGTLSTMIQALPSIGAERVEGQIVARPPAFDVREINFTFGRYRAMTIPWGDLVTAFHTTGIPNIRVYLAASRKRIAAMRRLQPWLPLLGHRSIKKILIWAIRRRVTGPSAEIRQTARTSFRGAVRNASGDTRKALLEAPEGYTLTAMTAVECVQRVLSEEIEPGARTPAGALGPDFITTLPGISASW